MTPLAGNFTPLNFDDVFASESIVDPCLIPLEVEEVSVEVEEVSGDFDLNLHQPVDVRTDEPLNESVQEFSFEERFEIIRSYHCDSPPSLSSIEKYDEVLKQDKKKYGAFYREKFEELRALDLGFELDADELINEIFSREPKTCLELEFEGKYRLYERLAKIIATCLSKECHKANLQQTDNLQETNVDNFFDKAVYFFNFKKAFSKCLEIRKLWFSFLEILYSCKPFLNTCSDFFLKKFKGINVALVQVKACLFKQVVNNGANEERMVAVVQEAQKPILQELQSLKERVSKSEIQVVPPEDYKDKYYVLLEKTQALQDKRIAELEDKQLELFEECRLKDKNIAELTGGLQQAHKVNEAVMKLVSIPLPVPSSSECRKEKIMERRRSFSQPPHRMSVLAR